MKKRGRPKGVAQARNEAKYWLPSGISLKSGQSDRYNKETKLIFVDAEFGEFTSTYKALQDANASTHPDAVMARRTQTNLSRYGVGNAGATQAARSKASATMEAKYGVKHALLSDKFLAKSSETLMKNHGVTNPMKKDEIKTRQIDTLKSNFGVENPMMSDLVKQKIEETNLKRHGVKNAAQSTQAKEAYCKTMWQTQAGASGEETELKEYIISLGLEAKSGYFGGSNPKQIDILVENRKVCFEYNGCFWHSEFNRKMTPKYHLDKTNVAKSKGYRLIHIFDYEWNTRKTQIKGYIKSALGMNTRKVFGRKTVARDVPKDVATDFLETYHILGKTTFKYAYGLYLDEELLCLVTINTHHRNNSELVLNRYVGKENVTVCGGLSKLTKKVKELHGQVSTWVDLRFSDGSNWEKSGWELVNVLKPDYFYYDSKTAKIVSKQSRQKSLVGTPEGMTEHEHAKIDKLYKVYDCGKIKLRIK